MQGGGTPRERGHPSGEAVKAWSQTSWGEEGSLLLEVVVGLLLVSVLTVFLCGTLFSLRGRALQVESRWVGADELQADGESLAAWSWGPRVTGCWSTSGEGVNVAVQGHMGQNEYVLGVWADGWFVGEYPVEGAREVLLSDERWRAIPSGAEVVLRVRAPDSWWGPRWRFLVGSSWPVAREPSSGTSAVADWAPDAAAQAAVHLTASGSVAVTVNEGEVSSRVETTMTPITIPIDACGAISIALGDAVQSWLGEEGRSVDLYF